MCSPSEITGHCRGCRAIDRIRVEILNESREVIHIDVEVLEKFIDFSQAFDQSRRIMAPRDSYHVNLPCDCVVSGIRKITKGMERSTHGIDRPSAGIIKKVILSSTIIVSFEKGIETKWVGRFPITQGRALIDVRERDCCGRVVAVLKDIGDDY